MMPRKRFAAGALALALAASAAASAGAQQVSSPDAAAQDAESAKELERKALALLETAVAEAQGLKLVENRVRVQTAAAGLLWPRDEKAARALIALATEGVRSLLVGGDPADPQAQEKFQIVWQLRNEMLHAVAQHDPKLALEFLRATRQPPAPQNFGGPKQPDQELTLEADLAARVAAQDPKEAARIIEEGLRRGVTPNLTHALSQLWRKDPSEASRLATAAIARLRPDDLAGNYDMANATAQLLSATAAPEPAPSPNGGAARTAVANSTGSEQITVDAETRRALLEVAASAALGSSPDRVGMLHGLLSALRPLAPEVERYLPGRAAALRRRLSEFERTQDPRSRAWAKYQHLFQQQATVDALLEAAAQAPPEIRDDLYVNTAWRLHGEDQDRARQVAEKISNPQQRAQLLQEFERQGPWRAADKGDFDSARQLIASLPTPEQRASALVRLANSAAGRDQKKMAREFLQDARGQFPPLAQNGGQFGVQLEIASAYAALDPEEAFAIIEASINQLNELIAAAAIVDGFTFSAFREGELTAQGGHVWSDLIRRCGAGLGALAARDFARAGAAARKFERADARVMAELQLAQAVLNNIAPGSSGGGIVILPTSNRRVRMD